MGPYGRWIADYRGAGLYPFPVAGKRPLITAYGRHRPGAATTIRWAERFDAANLGLSTRMHRLAVFDADDPEAVALFAAVLGRSPLRVRTRRGEHWYFADPAGAVAGANHPGGQAFDIRASGTADFVLAPGSVNGAAVYEIVGYAGERPIAEYAARLRDLPPADPRALAALLDHGRRSAPRIPNGSAADGKILRLPSGAIPEGQRNNTLFQLACREAHPLRRRLGDDAAALAARMTALNDALCDPPLDVAEVVRLAASAWGYTLAGVNRPPGRRARYIREVLRRVGGRDRALALWGLLSQAQDGGIDLALAPARVAAAVPGWRHRAGEAAIAGLAEMGVLRQVSPGGRGRGRVACYRLLEPVISEVSFATALDVLGGDAAAVALLVFLVESRGAEGVAGISAQGMAQTVGGPFGGWTREKIVGAREALEHAGLIERLAIPRKGVRNPPAVFQLRATSVLKIPGIVPVLIHRPLEDTGSQSLVSSPLR
jgi:hypothetical protein